ncbi:hypothetical protein [Bacillus thuringiensis]|uniref:hypothetical protein n=1 Tax=Bacillus thuringiensis TaxID=1428 RepID=UPI000B43863D|nr:hypothetical protein [Bacillus thuringiensis]OTY11413.1 hypothetical protein BK734_12550 [Bacillus thuringiensis serovar kim]OUB15143.1 hypothetical protein BK733_22055 [Bacillus thuringiensis serovar xiaguangiensis]OUB15227.1 hypothetical protein BK733_22505 [Bacillus thuringiensis serovar xiaguangiensis]
MNKVTIEFGEGTEAWRDMQKVAGILIERGYTDEPCEEIGTVIFTKEIVDEKSEEDETSKTFNKITSNTPL